MYANKSDNTLPIMISNPHTRSILETILDRNLTQTEHDYVTVNDHIYCV